MTEQIALGEEAGDAGIDISRTCRIRDIAKRVRPLLVIVRQAWISGCADIARGEIGEQWIFAGAAVTVAGVTMCLAAEQVVAELFLRREIRVPACTTSYFEVNGVTSADAS
jgi:hypothetical protein